MFKEEKEAIRLYKLYRSFKKSNINMKSIISVIAKNWKTTVAGIAAVIIGVLMHNGVISSSEGSLILSILTGLGFVASKDGTNTNS